MANKRDTSKQKRARENRAQREAREARASAAATTPEQRRSRASAAPVAAPGKGSTKDRAAEKATRTRPVRPGDVPVDIDTLEGSWISKRMAVPGGRQVLTGLLLTILLTGLMLFMKFPPADAPKDAKATETLWQLLGPMAIVVLAVPLIAMFVAAHFTLSPHRRRIWIGAAIVVALEVFLGFSYYIFSSGFLLYALWRQTKVEGPPPNSRAARRMAAQDTANEPEGPVSDG